MGDISQWLAERWAGALANVIALMSGNRPVVQAHPGEPGDDGLLWWEQRLNPPEGAAVWAGARRDDWSGLGRWILAAAGIETVEEEDARNTWLEVAGQTAGAVSADVAARLRTKVEASEGAETGPPPAESHGREAFRVEVAAGDQRWTVWVVFSGALPDALARELDGPSAAAAAAPEESVTARTAAIARQDVPPKAPGPSALDILMDVELPVSVSFGRAQLPLKDVLKLTTGAIVELNRTVSDPVEVIVNNCVIARGEVVVVEGNYGVRIREIVSRENRMRSLR